MNKEWLTYKESGVDAETEERGLIRLAEWINKTRDFRDDIGASMLDLGYFAGVIKLSQRQGLAISTDGVGTKILLAQLMEKYDTIGIDCVAMNVNDLICVGAEPLAMVDYLAIRAPNASVLEQIAQGLHEGARQARITIPGGEIAQVAEMIRGADRGEHFDLVGTAVGLVELDKVLIGADIQVGDQVIAILSTGLHSNGFTLARRALFTRAKLSLDTFFPELGATIGEALLQPTPIYVRPVLDVLSQELKVTALVNITGGGFLNLLRVQQPATFELNRLPAPPPIFSLVQKSGNITDEEMYNVFNMGVGFCVVCREEDALHIQEVIKKHGFQAASIGTVTSTGKASVTIPGAGLVGTEHTFKRT